MGQLTRKKYLGTIRDAMATPQRFFPAQTYYHVYNRGNRKEDIFFEAEDYQKFLRKLKFSSQELEVDILAHCLMPNHFHLLIHQIHEHVLPNFMLKLCTSYAKYFNDKYEMVGRVFQDRFKAKPVEDERYLLGLSKYIHVNPREMISPQPLKTYRWSSYPDYLSGKSEIVKPETVLNLLSGEKTALKYKEFVESGLTEREVIQIEQLAIDL